MKRMNSDGFRLFSKFDLDILRGLRYGSVVTIVILAAVFAVGTALMFFSLNKSQSDVYAGYYRRMQPGYLASESVYSDKSYYLLDERSSDEAYAAAKAAIPPVFAIDMTATYKSLENASILSMALVPGGDDFLSKATGMGLSYEIAKLAETQLTSNSGEFGALLVQMVQETSEKGVFDPIELAEKASGHESVNVAHNLDFTALDFTAESISAESISAESISLQPAKDCLVPDEIEAFVEARLAGSAGVVDPGRISAIAKVTAVIAMPNMRYNNLMTEKLRSQVDYEDSKVYCSLVPGQIIVQENTIITEESSRILYLLSQTSSSVPKGRLAGSIILMLLVTGVCLLAFDFFTRDNLHREVLLIIYFGGSLLVSVIAYFMFRFAAKTGLALFEAALPIYFMPLLMSLLSGRRTAGSLSALLLSTAFCMFPGADFTTFFYCMMCSVSCVLLIRFLIRRKDIVKQWSLMTAVSLVYLIVAFLVKESSLSGYFIAVVFDVATLLLSFVAVSALLPLLENAFNIPTLFKLREMADGDSPILERLSQEAPGTYSHSMAVADIAEAAASAVGANALLARVGAMYHDIGKIDHAEYFTENISLQNPSVQNRHETINHNLSVAIIKSHVKLGVEKGRQLGLPQEVLDIIGNHHGNDVVTFFYNEALRLYQENPQQYAEPKIEEYAYLGEPPQTPEQAIVMLSDCSEAACRSIVKPTPNKIEKMVRMLLVKKIVGNQLNNCGMTITDLNTVVKSLSESLTGRYHSRISYSEEEKK